MTDREGVQDSQVMKRLALRDGGELILLKWEPQGSKSQANLIAVNGDGRIRWQVEPPEASSGDTWTDCYIDEAGEIWANSWSCWLVRIDPGDGRMVSREFTN